MSMSRQKLSSVRFRELIERCGAIATGDAMRRCVWLLASALPFDGDDINSLVRLIQRGTPNAPVPAERGEAAAQVIS